MYLTCEGEDLCVEICLPFSLMSLIRGLRPFVDSLVNPFLYMWNRSTPPGVSHNIPTLTALSNIEYTNFLPLRTCPLYQYRVSGNGHRFLGPWGCLNRKLTLIELPWELLNRGKKSRRIGNHTRWMPSLLKVMTTLSLSHTLYEHTGPGMDQYLAPPMLELEQ